MSTEPTPQELEESLVLEAGADEIAAAAAVSVEDAETYLAQQGFDVAEERATAEAFLRDLGAPAAPVALHDGKPEPDRDVPEPPAPPGPTPSLPRGPIAAEDMREHAVDAYAQGHVDEARKPR